MIEVKTPVEQVRNSMHLDTLQFRIVPGLREENSIQYLFRYLLIDSRQIQTLSFHPKNHIDNRPEL